MRSVRIIEDLRSRIARIEGTERPQRRLAFGVPAIDRALPGGGLLPRPPALAPPSRARDGRWVNIAGLVLVRQKPGSAKGVMFITLEDETDVANLVIWPDLFEKHRRVVLGASMMMVRGRVQREGDVVHVIAQRLDDLSSLLASVGERGNVAGIYWLASADGAKNGGGPDPRDPAERPLGRAPRDIYIPDLRLGSRIVPGRPRASRSSRGIFGERRPGGPSRPQIADRPGAAHGA